MSGGCSLLSDGSSMRITSRGRSCAVVGNGDDGGALPDPKGRKEAMAQDRAGWSKSEQKELDSHKKNKSFEHINRSSVPDGRRLIKLIWVYKRKRDGSLKSRLCVQGCHQMPGVDYDQTWCGTMRSTSLRTLASIAAKRKLLMRRWDFSTAFLQGTLEKDEVVYCLPPPGYETTGSDGRTKVVRVDKPIYGMAQAARRWQRDLFAWFESEGFTRCGADSCVFSKSEKIDGKTQKLLVGVYVDDLAVVYSDDGPNSLYSRFAARLQSRWAVEDEGPVADLLNVQFESHSDGSFTLHQRNYIDKLVERYLPCGAYPR